MWQRIQDWINKNLDLNDVSATPSQAACTCARAPQPLLPRRVRGRRTQQA